MARIRTIKPETFDDPDLNLLPPMARWLFVGLWTQADKAGRLEDDPRRLKVRLLPYDDADCDALLTTLASKFIIRYVVDGKGYIQIINFPEHQHPHPKEAESVIPECPRPTVEKQPEPCNSTASTGKAGTSRAESGSGNGSGNGSGCGKDDGGLRPAPAPVKPLTKPLAYKPRIDVAWPGRPPVPSSLHAEFVSKLGGAEDDARQKLFAWYPIAAAPYDNQPIGDDDFTFWRARFREWVGTTRTAEPSRSVASAAPSYGAPWCEHDPRCASPDVHRLLLAREGAA